MAKQIWSCKISYIPFHITTSMLLFYNWKHIVCFFSIGTLTSCFTWHYTFLRLIAQVRLKLHTFCCMWLFTICSAILVHILFLKTVWSHSTYSLYCTLTILHHCIYISVLVSVSWKLNIFIFLFFLLTFFNSHYPSFTYYKVVSHFERNIKPIQPKQNIWAV